MASAAAGRLPPGASVLVVGWEGCPFHGSAVSRSRELVAAGILQERSVNDETYPTREAYNSWLLGPEGRGRHAGADAHRTSPFVVVDGAYVGGCDDFLALASVAEDGRPSPGS